MVDSANILAGQLGNVTLSSTWPETEDWTFLSLLRQFQAVSKLIATSQTRQIEREFFYVELGGFDTHNEFEKLDELFAFIDDSLDAFVKELKAQARSHRVPGFHHSIQLDCIIHVHSPIRPVGVPSPKPWKPPLCDY